jgi:hypothetical protein
MSDSNDMKYKATTRYSYGGTDLRGVFGTTTAHKYYCIWSPEKELWCVMDSTTHQHIHYYPQENEARAMRDLLNAGE